MKKMIILLGCVWGMMLSCTHDEPNNSSTGTGQRVVEWQDSTLNGDATMGEKMLFKVGGGMSVKREKGTTRATTDVNGIAKFTVDDLVTIGLTRGATDETKDYKVTTTTQTSTEPEVWTSSLAYNGSASDAFFWKSTGESVTVRAWSYGDGSTTSSDPDNQTYTLLEDQSASYGELLYSKATPFDYEHYSGGIPIQFCHQMTRLVISLTHIKPGDLDISEIYIGDGSETSIPTTAKFHKPTSGNVGTWDNIGSEKGQITPKTEAANSCYSAVLIPTTYEVADKKFVIIKTSDGRTYCYIPNQNLTLVAGTQYNYTISVKDLKEVSTLTIGDIADYTYDGTAKTPTPIVKDGTKTLVKDTDYELSYSNNINAGTATVTVTGKGGYYSGTQSKNFTINKKAATITLSASTKGVGVGVNGTITATLSDYDASTSISLTNSNNSYYTTSAGSLSNGVSTITIRGVSVTTSKSFSVGATSDNYSYTAKTCDVKVKSLKQLPLYYCMPYNVTATSQTATSSFAFGTSPDQAFLFQWSSDNTDAGTLYAVSYFGPNDLTTANQATYSKYDTYYTRTSPIGGSIGSGYHLPIASEWTSICPGSYDRANDVFTLTYDFSGQKTEPTSKFGYNASTKAGITGTSYWYKESANVMHAIRFIGTEYCSYWRYEKLGTWAANSTTSRLQITAILLFEDITTSNASTYLTTYRQKALSSLGTFNSGNGYDYADSLSCQRVFYMTGYIGQGSGQKSAANTAVGLGTYIWGVTRYSDRFCVRFDINDENGPYVGNGYKAHGFPVRLFRDN